MRLADRYILLFGQYCLKQVRAADIRLLQETFNNNKNNNNSNNNI